MSKYGLYFSGSTSSDQIISVDRQASGLITIGAHNKKLMRNYLHEIELSADDLETFGRLCILLAKQMRMRKS